MAGLVAAGAGGGYAGGGVQAEMGMGFAGLHQLLVPLLGEPPGRWADRCGSGGRLEELYLAWVRALPGDTRMLLLMAAAGPSGIRCWWLGRPGSWASSGE